MKKLIYTNSDYESIDSMKKLYLDEGVTNFHTGKKELSIIDMRDSVTRTHKSKLNNDKIIITVLGLIMRDVIDKIKRDDIDKTNLSICAAPYHLQENNSIDYASSKFVIDFTSMEYPDLSEDKIYQSIDITLTVDAILTILNFSFKQDWVKRYNEYINRGNGLEGNHIITNEMIEYIGNPYIEIRYEIYLQVMEVIVDGYDMYCKAIRCRDENKNAEVNK